MRRVVITGIGAVTSVGLGVTAFVQALRDRVCGVSDITSFDTTGFATHKGCEVRGFDASQWMSRVDSASLGKAAQFAVAAATMAVSDAGIGSERLARSRCGVSIGTTDGESQVIDRLTEQAVRGGYASISHELVRQVPSHHMSFAVARELGLRGGAVTINHHDTDPRCDLDCVPNHSRKADLRVVQNNGFAFGGNNAITVYARYAN